MDGVTTLPHGTAAWFAMVGGLLCEAATQAALPPTIHISLVERYSDGAALGGGLIQGLRFDIAGGQPTFRVGAHPGEQADITVEVSAAASLTLNSLYSADPAFHAALAEATRSGALRIYGDLGRLGDWFGAVHDAIVDRTAAPATHHTPQEP
jgi:hypothetical protein